MSWPVGFFSDDFTSMAVYLHLVVVSSVGQSLVMVICGGWNKS